MKSISIILSASGVWILVSGLIDSNDKDSAFFTAIGGVIVILGILYKNNLYRIEASDLPRNSNIKTVVFFILITLFSLSARQIKIAKEIATRSFKTSPFQHAHFFVVGGPSTDPHVTARLLPLVLQSEVP